MSLLFETIRINDSVPVNLSWHERRMNRARIEMWGVAGPVSLAPLIRVPAELAEGVVKCNVEYGPGIGAIYYKRYEKRRIASLKLVPCNPPDYHLKYLDRTGLKSLLEQRSGCDEIIIVKDGFITDTSMSNLVFFDGIQWFTPSTPLLSGTCRERLLAERIISERPVRIVDLHLYQGVKLINAMRDFDDDEIIPIRNIHE